MTSTPSGNHVILINADATPSAYAAARFADKGPDGRLNWDNLDQAGIYLGHLENQLGGGPSGGAVVNATGAKVYAESLGFEVGNLPITSLDGSTKTIMEAARDAGKVTALIQSGAIFEPGTAAFVAKTSTTIDQFGNTIVPRAQAAEIAKQVINSGVDFILTGGELNLLPLGTNGFHGTAAQLDAISTASLQRPTENLIQLAISNGYTVVYTKQQLTALLDLPVKPTKVLGVFAPVNTFNDRPEEVLAAQGLPRYRDTAPTIAEMLDVTQKLIESHPNFANGSIVVAEEEGIDNFGNNNNAVGVLEAVRRADAAIGVALEFVNRHSNTLMITAADADPGGLQVIDPRGAGVGVGTINNNPTTTGRNVPIDGQSGANTSPFVAAPDGNGNASNFGIAWAGTPDFGGSIIAKAHGLNAANLPATLDNTKIYEMMHEALFGQDLVSRNPDPTPAPSATKLTGNVIYILPDGASPSHYMAARNTDLGPDGRLNWDRLSAASVVSNHAANQLTASSSSGALAHATGAKVFAESLGLNQDQSRITSASGKVGITVLEEAIAARKATALVQSGRITDPGTAAFVAEISNRDGDNVRAIDKHAQIAEQIIRSGTQVIMGGGEINLLPKGTTGFHVDAAIDALYSDPNDRPAINLIDLAISLGYTIVYTKDQMNAAVSSATADTKLLGVFAADRTFNARPEEFLDLNSASPQPLYSNTAPTVSEMLAASLAIVKQDLDGFFVVVEENGVRRFGASNNAVGTVEAVRRADAAIGVAMDYVNTQDPNTLVVTAPTGDAGGLQVFQYLPFTRPSGNSTTNPVLSDTEPSAPFIRVNPTTTNTNRAVLDGVNGSTGSPEAPWRPFSATDSLDGPMGNFGISWAGTGTFVGSTVAKAYGMNADQLPSTIDNTEIYALMRQTLFRSLSVASVGTANADGAYGIGSQITLTLRLPEQVFLDVTAGTPTLTLETGETDRTAVYRSGSGTDTLVFAYTVQAGDSSPDLDLSSSSGFALNGATIQDGLGNSVDINLPVPGAQGSLGMNANLDITGVTPHSLSISTSTPVILEGSILAVAISSSTLDPGSTTYWQFSGTGITDADFSPSGLSGSIALGSDGRAAFSRSIALDASTEGDEQLTLEFFSDSARTLSLGQAVFTIKDLVPVSVAGATDGRDLLTGTAADESISGVPLGSVRDGRGSYDTLTGNGGNDLFILGTSTSVFYDDGVSTTSGAADLAAITDFSAGDRIQLNGSAAHYRLASGRVAGATGVQIYRLNPAVGTTPGATDELIGFLRGLTPSSLNLSDSSQFIYA